MCIDFASGMITAALGKSKKSKSGGMSSKVGWTGLAKKFSVLMLIVVAVRIDILLNSNYVRDTVCIAFCCNELISILENAGLMGIQLPDGLKNAIDLFIKAVSLLLENREEIAANVEMIRKAICNTAPLENDKERLYDEMSMLSEMVQSLISENARTAINQNEYNKRYQSLSKQYEEAKERYEQVHQQIQELNVRSQQLKQFQRQLFSLDAVTEFDEALWGTLVDFITVTENEKIVTFRDGTEITI